MLVKTIRANYSFLRVNSVEVFYFVYFEDKKIRGYFAFQLPYANIEIAAIRFVIPLSKWMLNMTSI